MSLVYFTEKFLAIAMYFARFNICFEKFRHDHQMAALEVNVGCCYYVSPVCRSI